MAAKFPISFSKLTAIPRLSYSKESKLKFNLKPRMKNGAQGESTFVDLNLCTPVSKQKYCCVLCQFLLRDPCHVTCCSSNYCRECVDRLSTSSGKCANSNCRKNYSVIVDGAALDELWGKITQMKVYCVLKNNGCKWVGTIEELENDHFLGVDQNEDDPSACQFQHVSCQNSCGVDVPRGKLTEHRLSECGRELSACKFCGVEDSDVYKVHQRMCPSFPVECPNKCAVPGIARSQILYHLENECPLRLVACKYRHVGCEDQVRQKNLDEHNTVSYQKHLDLMSEKLVFVSNENDELRMDNDSHQKNTAMLLSKVEDFQEGLATAEDILECYHKIKSAHKTTYLAPSAPTEILIKELTPQEEEGLSTTIASQASPETEDFPKAPARRRRGAKDKSKARSQSMIYEEGLPDLYADHGHTQQASGNQVHPSPSERGSSEPNIPSLFDEGGVKSKVAPKVEESNVELLGYRQIGSESSISEVRKSSTHQGSITKNSGTSLPPSAPRCEGAGPKKTTKKDRSRGVTFKSSVEVISDFAIDFDDTPATVVPASTIPDGSEEDVFSTNTNSASPLGHQSVRKTVSDDPPRPEQHSEAPQSLGNDMRPRSRVISASSLDNYDANISDAIRSRSQSTGSRRRKPPPPPKPTRPSFPTEAITSPVSDQPAPLGTLPLNTERYNIPSDTTGAISSSDVGPLAVSLESLYHRNIAEQPEFPSELPNSTGPPPSQAGAENYEPFGSYPATFRSNSESLHDKHGPLSPSPERLLSMPAGVSAPFHSSLASADSLPIHDMGDLQEELNKRFMLSAM